jgi:isopentenyl-diphosphate delta-isomerase
MKTSERKFEHIKICLKENVEIGSTRLNEIKFYGLEDFDFIHKSLPEINFDEIDTSIKFFGKELNAPIIISGMTGGTKIAEKINKNLAIAAQQCKIAFGVGSQRAAIENPELAKTYYVRDVAPDIFIIANLGAIQLNYGYGVEEVKKAFEMIRADALALHLNALQEIFQPEGDKNWKGCLKKIEYICKHVDFPIIVKETGAGISKEIAKMIEKANASAIDISGFGGTSWPLIESKRNSELRNSSIINWGIPTAISLIECVEAVKIPIIASGGIRNGIEIAKCMAIGATAAGIALPFLKPATKNYKAVKNKIEKIVKELKMVMFLVGAENMKELKKVPIVITGKTKDWVEARGIDVKKFANR